MTYSKALSLLSEIVSDYHAPKPLVIAIDGRTASGKTTFANQLSQQTNSPVIHTDDFFRPRDEFGRLHISEFNGNFDSERFKREVVSGILSENSFNYGIFDCKVGKIVRTETCLKSNCYIIEGSYSCSPILGDYADIKLFFDISPELQKERILSRNGVEGYNNFVKLWIPAEERYISHYLLEKHCNYTVISQKGL